MAHALDPSADDLADVCAAEARQNQRAGHEAVIARELLAEDVPVKINLHEQRRAARELDEEPRKIAQRQQRRAAGHGERQAERDAQRNGERGDAERREPALPEKRAVIPDRTPRPAIVEEVKCGEGSEAEQRKGECKAHGARERRDPPAIRREK